MDSNTQNHRHYLVRLLSDPVSILLIMLIIGGSAYFWSQSRVPALDQKSQLGERNNISSIAFDVVYPVHIAQPIVERIVKTTINWSYTNWKGMTFGLFFGVIALSILQLHPPSNQTSNPFLNSLIGMTSGAPLGVCVNCATPIAQGMFLSGLRIETVLATLISSPTLNVIVLTTSFSLFPTYFAITKVLGSVCFIVLVIPLVVRLVGKKVDPEHDAAVAAEQLASELGEANTRGMQRFNTKQQVTIEGGFSQVILRTGKLLLNNAVYLFRLAVPLMLFAGFLGSILIEAIPLQNLTILEYSLLSLIFVASVAVLLPVPIAFDVIAVSAILATGISPGIAMTMLFALGAFSIYPAMIIAKTISIRLSLGLITAVITFAVLLGLLTEQLSFNISQNNQQLLERELAELPGQHPHQSPASIAHKVCQSSTMDSPEQCYLALIESGSLGEANPNLCTDFLNPGETNDRCRNTMQSRVATSTALKDDSLAPCSTLQDQSLIDSCVIRVLITRSFSPDIAAQCTAHVSPDRFDNCMENVYLKRIEGIANEEACDIARSEPGKTHCLQLLAGYKSAETRNVTACTSHSNPAASRLCYSLVFAESPEQQTAEFCQSLTSRSNSLNCMDEIIARKALAEADEIQCSNITAAWSQLACQSRIVASRFQIMLLDQSPPAVGNTLQVTGSSLAEKPPYQSPPGFTEFQVLDQGKLPKNITLEAAPYAVSRELESRPLAGRFIQHPGNTVGLKKRWQFKFTEFFDPFVLGRGIGSGDFDNDGWSDIAISTNSGVVLYRNFGGLRFEYFDQLNVPLNMDSFVVSLVDLDNDGWLEVFASAYGGRVVIFNNRAGHFDQNDAITLTNDNANVSLSTGFADWDQDGDLDIYLGNWSFGTEENFRTTYSVNQKVTNNQGSFLASDVEEITGDTLSVLFSDLDNNGILDLVIGNDRHVPDLWYLGSTYGFDLMDGQKTGVTTSLNTMSYESADFNNDLLMDIFSTDMSFDSNGATSYCELLQGQDIEECQAKIPGATAILNLDIAWCRTLETQSDQSACLAAMTIKLASTEKKPPLCNSIADASAQKLCLRLAQRYQADARISYDQYSNQQMSNKLLLGLAEGGFQDATHSAGVQSSYWSWSAKAADLDNDGYQDIYIGNGYEFGNPVELFSNVFFHNLQGAGFKRAEEAFNLDFMPNTSSFTYADFDRDGDLDIVTSSVMSQPFLFENQTNNNNSIQFSLRDQLGNRYGVGARITIYYGTNLHQMREIKLSGGYQSFDETVATFGLHNIGTIDKVEVRWPTGEMTVVEKLPANSRYRITRQ